MKKPIRVAIIGCGWAGVRHAHAYKQCGAEVRWTVDSEGKRAESLRAAHDGARAATDYRSALDDPDVEAVDICLPHALHAPAAVAAAEAGKHVLCEKPMAGTLEDADQMIKAAERTDVILMIAENVRFNPLFHQIRDLLQAGLIGQPALIQMTREAYLARSFMEERRWFLDDRAACGGIMMSGGIHDFETMRMLIGEIESVHALRARQRFVEMEGDDTSIALVRFCDGTVGTLVESFVMKSFVTAAGPEVHTLRIDGELGSLSVQDGVTIRLFSERKSLFPVEALSQHEIYVPEADTFALEIEHFLESIRTGKEPITSGRYQRRPLELVLAAYQSMASGQPVKCA
ncbi:Gfo/Idh/MocA family oxidoreductase [Candidatus Poribacteria bacterium]|nr:Gfo/Idh/MocA family oxidoreductase [Candidatus Poribacteria bacterium]